MKFLIVEDDDALRERLLRSFNSHSLTAYGAANIQAAKEIHSKYDCSHAVLDIRLNKENGISLIPWLKERGCNDIVMLSGFGSIDAAVDALKKGAKNFLSKPLSFKKILDAFDISDDTLPHADNIPTPSLAEVEWLHIQRVLHAHGGNITKAAAELGIHRQALQRKLRNSGAMD